MTTLQVLCVPQALLLRGLCRKSRRIVDASSMWAILEAELNKANTFNVCSHGEYSDEDCKPFRFRTMLWKERHELALEIRKLSSDEWKKVVHIIKKERLFGKVLSRCSVSRIKDDLDSLSASTQSEIVLFMHGLHLDDSPSWYREYELAQGFVDGFAKYGHNRLTSKDPRIHPTFEALSPFWRCRKLVTFMRKVVLALQANVAFKHPFNPWRADVSLVCIHTLTHFRFKVHLTSCEGQEDSFSSIFILLTSVSLSLQKRTHTHTHSGILPIRARMTRRRKSGSADFGAYLVILHTMAPCATLQWPN